MSDGLDAQHFTESTVEIVAAYVSNNSVSASDLPGIITTVDASLRRATEVEPAPEKLTPAVSVRRSVKKDHIVCLVCGQENKMLKRHLMTAHDLSPDSYRALFDLKPEYPLVAPNYAEARSKLARKIGLGRNRGKRRSKRK